METNFRKSLLAACVLSLAVSSCVQAADKDKASDNETVNTYTLDEYIVTANRTPERIFDANASVNIITHEDIERMQYETLDKALTRVPGVQFQNYMGNNNNANMTTPVRINGSKNVLILVDGVRLTPAGSGAASINPNFLNNLDNVERIEVLKGSAGALYGSDAAGGVINIITKKGQENKSSIKSSWGSGGKENYHFSNSGNKEGFAWNIYYDKDIRRTFEDGRGKEWDNDWNSHSGGFSLSKEIGDNHKISVKYNQHDAKFLSEDPYDYNENLGQYQKNRGENYMQETVISHDWNFDDETSNKLTYRSGRYSIFYQESSTTADFLHWGGIGAIGYKSETVNEQFTKKFGDKHTLIAGVEWNRVYSGKDDPNAEDKTDFGKTYVNYSNKMVNTSYYIQDKWNITDKWNVTGGLRYDKANFRSSTLGGDKDAERDMDSNLSKSLTLGYKFDEKNNMYVSYNDYFILPSPMEINYGEGNINLEPSNGQNYSVGYNHVFDDSTQVSVHGFSRKADVAIGFSEIGKYENYKNSRDKGFDIQLDKSFGDRWTTFVGYSYLKHTSDASPETDRVKFGYLPRHSVNIGVNYNYDNWDVGLTGRGFLGRDGDAPAGWWPNDRYWVFNLGANYKMSDSVKVFAVVNNIFDQYYVESSIQKDPIHPGDGYAMPGRHFVLGMEVSF